MLNGPAKKRGWQSLNEHKQSQLKRSAHQLNDASFSTRSPAVPCNYQLLHADSITAHLAAEFSRGRSTAPEAITLDTDSIVRKFAIRAISTVGTSSLSDDVGSESETSSLDNSFSMRQGIFQRGGGRICGSGAVFWQATGFVVEHLANVVVEPHPRELLGSHVAGTVDGAAAGGCAAEAFEGLGHVPFRGWVEKL